MTKRDNMKPFLQMLSIAGAAVLALTCSKGNTLEPEVKEYGYNLAVLNENYVDKLVLSQYSTPVGVGSTDNFPAWIKVSTAEVLNEKGHPVLNLDVKADPALAEPRTITGKVNLTNGDILTLTVSQETDLPGGLNGDILVSTNTAFEADWASCSTISLVTSYMDVNGRTQVTTTEVALPWASNALPSEWLPEGEAESMVALKDQWELVFNLTGIPSRPNCNYFALYNKYMGKLRIFYYIDKDQMPSGDGNDHLWSLYFSDKYAEYPVFHYGIPYNVGVSGTYKQLIGSPNIQYMTSARTSQMTRQGKVTPRVGWWAYDIDMSQLRPTSLGAQNGYITPGLLLFNQDNVFLNSIVDGNIDGSISGKINLNALMPTSMDTAGLVFSDIFTFLNATTGSWGVGSLATGVLDGKDGFIPGAIFQGIASGVFSTVLNIIEQNAYDDPADEEELGAVELTAKLRLNAKMVTQGTIGGERSSTVPSPKVSSEYFKEGTHFGQGVWNISDHPVIYVLSDAFWSSKKQFITYVKGEEKDAAGNVVRTYYTLSDKPSDLGVRLISFFDPTSIGSIVLNRDVYSSPSSIDVTQTYGTYPGSDYGFTAGYRAGLGVSAQTVPISYTPFSTKDKKNGFQFYKFPHRDDIFNYEVPQEFASFMAPRLSEQTSSTQPGIRHRFFGQSLFYHKVNPAENELDQVQYVVDPEVYLAYNEEEYKLYDPDYVDWVVTVGLRIVQGDRIFLLDRQFIPEVKVISAKDLGRVLNEMKARRAQLPTGFDYVGIDEMIARAERYYNTINE